MREVPLYMDAIGAIGALMNIVHQPHTLLVRGLNAVRPGSPNREWNWATVDLARVPDDLESLVPSGDATDDLKGVLTSSPIRKRPPP